MHALGANHEHLRVDRDKFLRMRWDNINPQYYDYFAISDPLSYSRFAVGARERPAIRLHAAMVCRSTTSRS